MSEIFGNSMQLMLKSMDFLWKKQEVIANNIANVDTPGYKSRYVTFEEELREKLDRAREDRKESMAQALADTQYEIHVTENETARLDGNNVNADTELIEMTRAAMQYQYAQSAYNGELNRLRTAIKG